MQAERPNPGVRDRVHYVPGEICAVLAVENDFLAVQPDGRATRQTLGLLEALYQEVQNWLNGSVERALRTWQPGRPGRRNPLDQDLEPASLRQGLDQGKVTRLQRPTRDGLRRGQALEPYVLLPRAAGRSTVLACYTIEGPQIQDGPRQDVNDWRVPELVNLVNRRLLQGTEAQRASDQWNVVAATPNWITAGAQNETCPGPGSRPERAAPGQWGFTFPGSETVDGQTLAEVVDWATKVPYPSGVIVAVLDTSPPLDSVQQMDQKINPPPNSPANALLHTVVASPQAVGIDGALSADEQYFQFLAHLSPNWHTHGASARPQHHFQMPDHGLFSAGIIRSIAPAAEVHLIRVLNEFGVGDVMVLAKILSALPDALLKEDRQRLVINMSLMCDVPISERLMDFWFPSCSKNLKTLCDCWTDICATFNAIQTSIQAAVSWTQEHADRVLVVAAAGNDNLEADEEGYSRPEPRYPARYDDVFGVAAVKSDGTASDFSNRGDIAIMGNGVAVYGGNAAPSGGADPPHIPPRSGSAASGTAGASPDAVVGIYTAANFPLMVAQGQTAPPNKSGWAYWSGTSFATPIISAIAADYWAQHRNAKPWQIRSAIRGFQTDLDGELDVPAITAVQ